MMNKEMQAATLPHLFAEKLLRWYKTQGRHDLPWKKQKTAYPVWLSEIMLQQTQVSTVIPYFERFMKAFPNVKQLGKAPLDQVLHYWSGLGYYARARNLHKTAQIVTEQCKGSFPRTVEELQALPGIGRSTAGAIVAQAFNQFAPILDANVKRVLSRYHCIEGYPGQKEVEERLWRLANAYTPRARVADYTQAIMDLGATCCTRTQPQCHICPLQSDCLAHKQGTQTHYPHKKVKKAVPKRTVTMLIVRTAKHVLLEQRPLKGIWAGLWSLPEFSDHKELEKFLKKTLLVQNFTRQVLEPFIHTFTHFHLQISPMLVILRQAPSLPEKTRFSWVNAQGLTQRGLPAPIKKLLITSKSVI